MTLRRPFLLRILTWSALAFTGAVSLGLCAAFVLAARTPLDLGKVRDISPVVLAEDGSLLRAYLSKDHKWRFAVGLAEVAPTYVDILVAYEDRRFWSHHGVDASALARAAIGFFHHQGKLSGASTLTMQVARLLAPSKRGIVAKLRQMGHAFQLERQFTKAQILELYLTLAPFGGNLEGVQAASLAYFGKPARDLDAAEAALLVAISQAPASRRPERFPEAARDGRNRVLRRAVTAGVIDTTWLEGGTSPVTVRGPAPPMIAPHLSDRLRRQPDPPASIRTAIDASLQRRLEQIGREALDRWPPEMNAAMLVLRNRDCSVRAYVGGTRYVGAGLAGRFDHVRAVRSPGSTLKPLIYAMGFEDLVIHPLTVVTDQPVHFEGYAPRNFNEGFQGDMTVRDALIKSINTTAVAILSRVGPSRLIARLRSGGIDIRTDDTDVAAGLAVGLGGAGMQLEGLVRHYSGFAAGGLACDLGEPTGQAGARGRHAMTSGEAAWAIADILADSPPPLGFSPRKATDGGRRIAYKTGTSYGFRDAWAIGFDADHTIGIWLGRSDGVPTLGATGASTAAPLLYRAFDALPVPARDVAAYPHESGILARRHDLPERLRRFGGALAGQEHRLRILFPRDNSTVDLADNALGTVTFTAAGGAPPYLWFVDDRPIDAQGRQVRWQADGTGQVRVRVLDASGGQSVVSFWVR